MSVHQNVAASGPFIRIALPSWRMGAAPVTPAVAAAPQVRREEFQKLMDTGIVPGDMLHTRLTKAERRQLSAARRLRHALYPSADLA